MGRARVLKRTLPTTLLVVLACAPAAAASPRAHSAAQQRAEASLNEAEQLLDGHGVRTGREVTPALLEVARRIRHLRGDERREAIALLSRPTDADAPADERYTVAEEPPVCDANFCVHWVASTSDVADRAPGRSRSRRGERGPQLRERDARAGASRPTTAMGGSTSTSRTSVSSACSASRPRTPSRTS